MARGFNNPESYSNEHISDLINIIKNYNHYIDTFDSIEINKDSNCLDKNNYLIDKNLHNMLINSYDLKRDITIN